MKNFKEVRLLFQLQRKEMESHLQSASSLHLDLARVKLDNTEVRLNITKAKLNDAEVKLSETHVKLYNTEETTRGLIEKLDILQRQFENKLVEDQGNATDQEKLVMEKQKVLITHEVRLESVPFYTKRYVYKLKVTFHPNGHISDKNTHLSVYIVIMKGEFDAIIAWSFKKKVRVILIDQQENPVERQNVVRRSSPGDHPELCKAY